MKAYYIDLIQEIIKPHLYASGFIDRKTRKPIQLYAPREKLAWALEYPNEYMSDFLHGGPDAVTDTGFGDAHAGGMIETPFEDTPIEDLERFLGVIEQFDFIGGSR